MDRQLKILTYFVFVLLALLIALPVIYTYSLVIFQDSHFTENIQKIDLQSIKLLFKSILWSGFVAGLSTLIGGLLGFLLYKTPLKYKTIYKLLLLMPLILSPYIWAVAWQDFFYLMFNNSHLLSSFAGVIWVQTLIYTPLAILIIGNALSNIDKSLEETALTMSSPKNTILKISLPLVKPAFWTAFVLIFIFSLSEFSVPALFGVKVFTTEIFTNFSAFYNYNLAIIQSTLLIIISLWLLWTEAQFLSKAPFLSVGSRGNTGYLFIFKKQQINIPVILNFWIVLSVLLPFFVLSFQALKSGYQSVYQAFKILQPAFIDSFIWAVTGSVISIIMALIFSYFSWQSKRREQSLIRWTNLILLITFGLPAMVYGISLIYFYNRPVLGWIYGSAAILVVGFVGKYGFIALKMLQNATRQIPFSLDEAAQLTSASIFKRFKTIYLPLMLPAILAVFVLNFILMSSDLAIPIMTFPPGTQPVSVKVFTMIANASQSLTSAMIFVFFTVTLSTVSLLYLILKNLMIPKHVHC